MGWRSFRVQSLFFSYDHSPCIRAYACSPFVMCPPYSEATREPDSNITDPSAEVSRNKAESYKGTPNAQRLPGGLLSFPGVRQYL